MLNPNIENKAIIHVRSPEINEYQKKKLPGLNDSRDQVDTILQKAPGLGIKRAQIDEIEHSIELDFFCCNQIANSMGVSPIDKTTDNPQKNPLTNYHSAGVIPVKKEGKKTYVLLTKDNGRYSIIQAEKNDKTDKGGKNNDTKGRFTAKRAGQQKGLPDSVCDKLDKPQSNDILRLNDFGNQQLNYFVPVDENIDISDDCVWVDLDDIYNNIDESFSSGASDVKVLHNEEVVLLDPNLVETLTVNYDDEQKNQYASDLRFALALDNIEYTELQGVSQNFHILKESEVKKTFYNLILDGTPICKEQEGSRSYFGYNSRLGAISHLQNHTDLKNRDDFQTYANGYLKNNLLEKNLHKIRFGNLEEYDTYEELYYQLEGLKPGESTYITLSVPGNLAGHAVILKVEKQKDDKFTLTLYNSGLGIDNHDRRLAFCKPGFTVTDVAFGESLFDDLWKFTSRTDKEMFKNPCEKNMDELYDLLKSVGNTAEKVTNDLSEIETQNKEQFLSELDQKLQNDEISEKEYTKKKNLFNSTLYSLILTLLKDEFADDKEVQQAHEHLLKSYLDDEMNIFEFQKKAYELLGWIEEQKDGTCTHSCHTALARSELSPETFLIYDVNMRLWALHEYFSLNMDKVNLNKKGKPISFSDDMFALELWFAFDHINQTLKGTGKTLSDLGVENIPQIKAIADALEKTFELPKGLHQRLD